jgi:hypothetical protein
MQLTDLILFSCNFLIVAIFAFLAACTTEFFFFIIGNPQVEYHPNIKPSLDINHGMIFSNLGIYLGTKFIQTQSKLDEKDGDKKYRRTNWFKIFVCRYCFNVYSCFVVWLPFHFLLGLTNWQIFFIVPLSHFLLRKI